MKKTVFAVVSFIMISAMAIAQQKGSRDEADLLALEEKWDIASMKGDAAALELILAEKFVSTTPEGKLRTKSEVLDRLKSGAVKYQSSKVDDMKPSVFGDAAIVTGRWKGKYVENGKTIDARERFTDTFVRQKGQWKCVASHSSNAS